MLENGGIWVQAGLEYRVVDPRYFADCVAEDAWPTRFGGRQSWATHRLDLPLDGGNLLTDGHGTCFTTTSVGDRDGRVVTDVVMLSVADPQPCSLPKPTQRRTPRTTGSWRSTQRSLVV